jgi:hypothetical protein
MKLEISFSISISIFEKLGQKNAEYVRSVGDRFLHFDGDSHDLVDYEELPDDEQEKRRFDHKKEKLSRNHNLRSSRQTSYKGQSAEKIAGRATDNPYIMGDILDDPGLVDADGQTEAVAKVASENPGWAKMSDLADRHDIDIDTGESTGDSKGSASTGDGDGSTSAAEAASDAASFDGDVSTADSADLGPTGPSGYGDMASSSVGDGGVGDGGDVGGSGGVGGDGSVGGNGGVGGDGS